MEYYMNLHDSPFNKIKEQSKTIEMRLNDEKRKVLKVNDIIIFTNNVTNEKIKVVILDLYRFDSFKEVYEKFDKVSLGYEKDEIAHYKDMHLYYSEEDIKKYGVLAIKIKVIWCKSYYFYLNVIK